MTPSLTYLALTLVLAVFQVMLAAGFKRRQDGLQWAAGSRDARPQPYTGVPARLDRAQANLFETLPLVIGAVLLAHVSAHETHLTNFGTALYFWARVGYVPLYAAGLNPWRSLVWGISVVGLVLILISLV